MSNETENAIEKLNALRAAMKGQNIDGYLVPRTDEFQGEYVPECAQRLVWLTGFTGSAGIAIILNDRAAVFSDGRYSLQIKEQIDAACYEALITSKDLSPQSWLAGQKGKYKIGYDPRLHTVSQIKHWQDQLKGSGHKMVAIEDNLIDQIWSDRPAWPKEKLMPFSNEIAGKTAKEKCADIAEMLKEQKCETALITTPDSVAWLLNIRGNDVAHLPVPLSYAMIDADGHVRLYIDPAKITSQIKQHLGNQVEIRTLEDIKSDLESLSGRMIAVDETRAPIWFKNILDTVKAKSKHIEDPCVALRAVKTEAEQKAIRDIHIRDGVALVKFLKWIEEEGPGGTLTELSVEEKLLEFRKESEGFADVSFDTIAGWAQHGAVVHYRATPETNLTITPPGLLLVDSGQQNKDGGTTDVTRTIAIGNPTPEMIENYTLVLKGHIGIAKLRFPAGTTGKEIDPLARQALWAKGRDYAHGTGHGVGCYLSVHEDGTGIHKRAETILKPGMLISNEPGYYKESEYGIRIENLVLVQNDGTAEDTKMELCRFDTVTMAPLDKNLIDTELLSREEKDWLNNYHSQVYQSLAPHLDEEHRAWLNKATSQI